MGKLGENALLPANMLSMHAPSRECQYTCNSRWRVIWLTSVLHEFLGVKSRVRIENFASWMDEQELSLCASGGIARSWHVFNADSLPLEWRFSFPKGEVARCPLLAQLAVHVCRRERIKKMTILLENVVQWSCYQSGATWLNKRNVPFGNIS